MLETIIQRLTRRTAIVSTAAALAGALAGPATSAPEPRFPFGVVWVAESLAGTPFSAVSRPTLRIAADGQAGGSAGCNRYGGRATLEGNRITFSPLAMTKMACFGAGGDNENRFAPALGTATGWRIERRTLVLETANGPLRFRRR